MRSRPDVGLFGLYFRLRSQVGRVFLRLGGARDHRAVDFFPTRRSSDLVSGIDDRGPKRARKNTGRAGGRMTQDRKSTRLNSSHANISYAVFCVKKKRRCIDYLAENNPRAAG